ncbi:membrane fusion protein (multidrug efflux system) [Sphaerotilus hippei]|uniref:Membrane fusion protein (Multidrug efflux system) n=1 Tax=Sphaerotilus hippei TaxID=744406 RepID=A0A318GX12_9BURK|nr:HlyD family secretion protein [Sphaerotilus hippei]PXW92289.1 membrane fusion protein (multidrug efflux system) [Sphaerotilus hippei]
MALSIQARLTGATVLVAVTAAAAYAYSRGTSDASFQATDDAYVEADYTQVAPRLSGTVDQVMVDDHQAVQEGELLAVLDDRDALVALESAKAQVLSARAALSSLQAQRARQPSVRAQARATVSADDAALALAAANRTRFQAMAQEGSGTLQAQQQADAQWLMQQAHRERDLAALQGVDQQNAVIQADVEKAQAALMAAQSSQKAAELTLSYTRITAPTSGVVAQRSVRAGAYVQAGKPLLAVVPLKDVYVTANFRETQLARMRPGQPVRLTVDALPGVRFTGHVSSLAPASGTSFSPLPAHNATGNFTKIVQRLPVRIELDDTRPQRQLLRVGMSVRPEVDVRTAH